MQQQKENLTAQVNDTVATQLVLEEEAARLKLALGNITSSLADAAPSPQLDQAHPTNRTTEVSLGSTCGTQMELVQYKPARASCSLINIALLVAQFT